MKRIDRESTLNEWFDIVEPRNAPPEILEKVFSVTRRSGQRRGWFGRLEAVFKPEIPLTRRQTMYRLMLSVGGIAAALLIAVTGIAFLAGGNLPGVGGPGASPTPSPTPTASPSPTPTTEPSLTASPSPSPTPAANVFVSERYSYALTLPDDGWIVLERPGEWQAGRTFTGADPGVDVVLQRIGQQPTYRHDVVINSQPLGEMSFNEWLEDWATIQRRDFPNCDFDDDFEMLSADNSIRANAYVWTGPCDGDRWAEAIWWVDFISGTGEFPHDGQVYVLRIGENRGSEQQIDPRQELEVWLDLIEINGRRW